VGELRGVSFFWQAKMGGYLAGKNEAGWQTFIGLYFEGSILMFCSKKP
jgi:hypothetical protein